MIVQRSGARLAAFLYVAMLSVAVCQAEITPATPQPAAAYTYAPLQHMLEMNRRTVPYKQPSHTTNSYIEFVKLTQKIYRDSPYSVQHQESISLFAKNAWFNEWAKAQHSVCEGTQTWRDLELFCGKQGNEGKYVGGTLQRAQSHIGAKCALALLAFSATDVAQITRRQAIVQAIVSDMTLQEQLTKERAIFKAAELSLLCTSSSNDILEHGVRWNQLYQNPLAQWLNRLPCALYLREVSGHIKRIVGFGMETALGITFVVYALYKLGVLRAWRPAEKLRNGLERKTVSVKQHFANSEDWIFRLLWKRSKKTSKSIYGKGTRVAIAALFGYLTLSYLPREVMDEYGSLLFIELLHEVTCHFAQLIRSARRLRKLMEQYPALGSCKELVPIKHFFERDVPASKSLQELCVLFDTSTFDGVGSLASTHIGRVIRAHALFLGNKEAFYSLCVGLGFVDAYLGIAQLYQEHQGTATTFCFPTFVTADKPLLAVEEVWHPYVEPSKAVVNTLTLGGEGGIRQALFTGPNTAGKSTFLKSIALAAYLAQGWGIVPAKSCTLTPFDIIETSLNITDDTAKGNSLFKQEVLRNGLLLERADQLPVGKYGAFFFDEMYNGTTPLEGIACAYSTAEGFINRERALSMVATHFDLLTELPALYPNCANYHFSVDPIQETEATSSKRFNCTFKVQPGVSHQHVALEILEEEGVASDVLASARAILKRLEAGEGIGAHIKHAKK